MYDRIMAMPRVSSAMRGRRIHSQGLRSSRIAEISVILLLTIGLAFAQVSPIHTVAATKPQPPPSSTSATWAKAYNVPYSYSVGESVAQTSNGGYVVGASCTAAAVTTPNCNTLSEPTTMVMRVDSSRNIQSQTQYNYLKYLYSTPLDLIRPTSDGGAIFAGNAQFGCPATGQTSCALIVKLDSNANVQWSNDLQYSTTCSAGPATSRFDLEQTSDGGFIAAGSTNQFNGGDNSLWLVKTDPNGNISGCNDVQTWSDVSGSVSVTVSISDLKATPDSFTYVADTISSLPGPIKATKEC